MNRKRLIIWITIGLMLIGVLAAFAYGKTRAEQNTGRSYFESLNDYDWSRTCPAAGCRNQNENRNED